MRSLTARMIAGVGAAVLTAGFGTGIALASLNASSTTTHLAASSLHTTATSAETSESAEASDAPESSEAAGTTSESASPTNHGDVVTSAVASCKAARPSPDASPKPSPGSRGIGECVSTVASGGHEGGKGSHPTPH